MGDPGTDLKMLLVGEQVEVQHLVNGLHVLGDWFFLLSGAVCTDSILCAERGRG